MAALVAATTCTGFTSCSDDDDAESTVNPATRVVAETKKYDTAILLCTFGSTYNESLDVYNEIIADFRNSSLKQTSICLSPHVPASAVQRLLPAKRATNWTNG